MKREELKKIIEYKLFRMKSSGSRLINLTRKFENHEEVRIDESEWFPKIEELNSEFEILKKEVKDYLKTDYDSEEFFKSYKCSHPVRIDDIDFRTNRKYQTCVLCGYNLFYKDYKHEKNNIAVFTGKEITDYYEGEYIIRYTDYKILNILLGICNISTTEEIDITKEIKKLKLDYCDIVRNKNRKYILFVLGSNRFKIDDYLYFSSDNNIYYKSLINKFRELFNVHITIIGRKEDLEEYKKEDDSIELLSYETIEELENLLTWDRDKYDLVIDMSSLFNIKVEEGKIKPERYKINYGKFIPSAKIIKINDLSKENRNRIMEYLKENESELAYNRCINSWFDFYRYEESLDNFDPDNPSNENCKLKGYLESSLFDETKKLLLK